MKKYANSKGIAPETMLDMFEDFCIYHRKKGDKCQSWYASWQSWVRKAIEFATKDRGTATERDSPDLCNKCFKNRWVKNGMCSECWDKFERGGL